MKRDRIILQCDGCGENIQLPPSKARLSIKHFCSRQCYGKWQSANMQGENNPGWKPPIPIKCVKCGTTFDVSPYDVEHRRYCSPECAGISKLSPIEVQCHWCNGTIERPAWWANRQERHFCDMKCRGEWQATQTGPNANAYKGTMVQVPCSHCGQVVERDPSKVNRNDNFFCSIECWNEWRSTNFLNEGNPNFSTPAIETKCAYCDKPIKRKPWRFGETDRLRHFCCHDHRAKWVGEHINSGENNANWKGGGTHYYGPNWYRQRQRARNRDNHTCQHCGITREKAGQSLDVHHVVPFRSFDYLPGENENYKQANRLANLITLCRSCHIKAEWKYS